MYERKAAYCTDCRWKFIGTSPTRARTALRRHRKRCEGTRTTRRAKLVRKQEDALRRPFWLRLGELQLRDPVWSRSKQVSRKFWNRIGG